MPKTLLCAVILSIFCISACKKEPNKKTQTAPAIIFDHTKDPVGVFCGADCAHCGFNVTKCLTLLKENLANLCGGPYKTNCYDLWLTYSKTCDKLCRTEKEKT